MALAFAAASCGRSEGERGDAPPAPAEQIARGKKLYQKYCYGCHGIDAGTGPALTPELLVSYGTAQVLHDYLSIAMPPTMPGELDDEEYWALEAYLLDSRGLLPDGTALTAQTAGDLRLRQRSEGG